jgi:transcriptional regulator with XRE-family HTH domain
MIDMKASGMTIQSTRIRERRKTLGLSQEELAALVDTNQTQISRYEVGENDPTGETLAGLARALQTTTDYLLGLSDKISFPVHTDADLNQIEREAIDVLRSSTPAKQRILVDIMREVLKFAEE